MGFTQSIEVNATDEVALRDQPAGWHAEKHSRRFAYRSGTDDGNPSVAHWAREVTEDPTGSRVTVALTLRPGTFWRRLLAPIRGYRRQAGMSARSG